MTSRSEQARLAGEAAERIQAALVTLQAIADGRWPQRAVDLALLERLVGRSASIQALAEELGQ